MILIADSGSTKTAWRLVDADENIQQYTTRGLNPVHLDAATLTTILQDELIADGGMSAVSVRKVFFYGAGCVPGAPADRLKAVLGEIFPNASTEVADDMLAVARGVCGHEPGIACILGTGSNSCLFDGSQIQEKVPALGYILGDEGSGSWLGKEFLAAFIRKELPAQLENQFKAHYDFDRLAILDQVYQGERPAAFLAGFSKFLFRHRKEAYVYQLVSRGFASFLERNVMRYEKYESLPVHFSGSVAFYYSSILRNVASEKGITLKNIVEGPIAGLTLYHHQVN